MIDSRDKTSVIPKVVYVLAALVYTAGYLLMRCAAIPSDPKIVNWPEGGKVFLSLFIPLIAVVWILLIGYIYGDSKRRGMRSWLWVLLSIFIPNAIGIILYFFLRDPLMFHCPSCGASAKSTYTFCPNCSTPLRPTCTQCGRGMERRWKHCPYCGAAAPAANQNQSPGGPPAPGPI